MTNLDEAQRSIVSHWIADGLKLSEIQNRLTAELGIRMTYMEVRLLVDDLKLIPKDLEPPKPATLPSTDDPKPAVALSPEPPAPAASGQVSVSVDELTRPGALVSGKVTFSDGNKAEWYLDQSGRLGLASQTPGYRPAASDVQQFQAALESELAKIGF